MLTSVSVLGKWVLLYKTPLVVWLMLVCVIALLTPFYESIVSSQLSLGMQMACRGLCMMILNTKILGNIHSFMDFQNLKLLNQIVHCTSHFQTICTKQNKCHVVDKYSNQN